MTGLTDLGGAISRQVLTAAGVSAALAAPVAAYDLGNGLTFSGDISYEYFAYSGDEANVAFGTLGLTWRNATDGGLRFGIDAEYDIYEDLRDDFSVNEYRKLWGNLVLSTDLGDFNIGSPRPALSGLSTAPLLGGSRAYDLGLQTSFLLGSGSFIETAGSNAFSSDTSISGMNFTGARGSFTYAAGYYRLDTNSGAGDFTATEVAASYTYGPFQAYLGVENSEGLIDQRIMAGASYRLDKWRFGAEMINTTIGAFELEHQNIYAVYSVNDRLDLTVSQNNLVTLGVFNQDLVAAAANYRFANGAYASLAYSSSESALLTQDTTSLQFGWKF